MWVRGGEWVVVDRRPHQHRYATTTHRHAYYYHHPLMYTPLPRWLVRSSNHSRFDSGNAHLERQNGSRQNRKGLLIRFMGRGAQ